MPIPDLNERPSSLQQTGPGGPPSAIADTVAAGVHALQDTRVEVPDRRAAVRSEDIPTVRAAGTEVRPAPARLVGRPGSAARHTA